MWIGRGTKFCVRASRELGGGRERVVDRQHNTNRKPARRHDYSGSCQCAVSLRPQIYGCFSVCLFGVGDLEARFVTCPCARVCSCAEAPVGAHQETVRSCMRGCTNANCIME